MWGQERLTYVINQGSSATIGEAWETQNAGEDNVTSPTGWGAGLQEQCHLNGISSNSR